MKCSRQTRPVSSKQNIWEASYRVWVKSLNTVPYFDAWRQQSVYLLDSLLDIFHFMFLPTKTMSTWKHIGNFPVCPSIFSPLNSSSMTRNSNSARVLIFCVEFRELSHLTRDLSQAEKEINFVTSWANAQNDIYFTQSCHFEWK